MDGFKYHVALENHIGAHYWSEKIADAFLCECLPFYAGAPDLSADFPAESFIPIPLDDPAAAVGIIKEAIVRDEWSKRRDAIRQARSLLLEKYNFWAQTIGTIEDASAAAGYAARCEGGVIRSRKWLRRHTISANVEDGWFHARQYLSGAGLWPKIS